MSAPQSPAFIEDAVLENGLKVEFYNASRAIAGDRVQVSLLIRIPLAVERSHFADIQDGEKAYRDFLQAFGPRVWFEQQKVRNFVDRSDEAAILRELQNEFLKINRSYLSRQYFEGRFILHKYREWKEQQPLTQPEVGPFAGSTDHSNSG